MALLKKLPRLLVWPEGYYPSEAASRSAAAAADTLPRLAWPPQTPSRARITGRQRVRHPHMAMGLIFLLILLTMLAVYASHSSAPAPYIQVRSMSGPAILQQSGPAAPSAAFWHTTAERVITSQVAPMCLTVTGN